MEESPYVNPTLCFQYSTQISLCIHFWKQRPKKMGKFQAAGH